MIENYPLNCGKHEIRGLDADEYGNFIALLSNGEVWTNAGSVELRHQFRAPIIRELAEGQFLIVEAGQTTTASGHIFDRSGQQLLTFAAGEYVADVLIQMGRIVISYFDQGVLSFRQPSSDGIAVFDFTGQQLFGLNSLKQYFLLDCYGMCRLGSDSILAYTYTGFPLLELRLIDYCLRQQPTPADFRGSHALTTYRGSVIFHGSYNDSTSFFWWNRQDKVHRFGNFPAHALRGIGNGKFLTFDARSFMIIDAVSVMREE